MSTNIRIITKTTKTTVARTKNMNLENTFSFCQTNETFTKQKNNRKAYRTESFPPPFSNNSQSSKNKNKNKNINSNFNFLKTISRFLMLFMQVYVYASIHLYMHIVWDTFINFTFKTTLIILKDINSNIYTHTCISFHFIPKKINIKKGSSYFRY